MSGGWEGVYWDTTRPQFVIVHSLKLILKLPFCLCVCWSIAFCHVLFMHACGHILTVCMAVCTHVWHVKGVVNVNIRWIPRMVLLYKVYTYFKITHSRSQTHPLSHSQTPHTLYHAHMHTPHKLFLSLHLPPSLSHTHKPTRSTSDASNKTERSLWQTQVSLNLTHENTSSGRNLHLTSQW